MALVEFRNTPTSYSDLSPNEWVYGRKVRALLPMLDTAFDWIPDARMKLAERQRFEYFISCKKAYDRRARDLPVLKPGTKVYVYDNGPGPNKGFTHPGEILSIRDPDNQRSYIVRLDSTGNEVSRNQARLQPVTEEPDPSVEPLKSGRENNDLSDTGLDKVDPTPR